MTHFWWQDSQFCTKAHSGHLWGTPELLGLESLHLLLFITHLSQSPGVGCAFPAFSSWACFWTTHWYLCLPCHFIMEPCHSDWLAHEFGSVPLELLNPYCGCSPGFLLTRPSILGHLATWPYSPHHTYITTTTKAGVVVELGHCTSNSKHHVVVSRLTPGSPCSLLRRFSPESELSILGSECLYL